MRTRIPWFLLLLALAGAAWLLQPALQGGAAASFEAEPASGRVKPLMLSGGGSADDAGGISPGPSLAGSVGPSEREGWELATVRVVSPQGDARVGIPVRIECSDRHAPSYRVLTGGDGVVELGRIPLDGSVTVKAFDRWTAPGALPAARVVGEIDVLLPETLLTCDEGLRLDVRIVDAESGEPISAECKIVAAVESPSVRDGRWGAQVALLPGGEQQTGLTFRGQKIQSHVSWGGCQFIPDVSRYAHRLEMVYPMRRHARVLVLAQEHDGRATEHAVVSAVSTAGRNILFPWRAVPHRGGWWLRGVPFFRGEPISVLLTRPTEPGEEAEEEEVEIEECCCCEVEEGEHDWYFNEEQVFEGAALGDGRLPYDVRSLLTITARFPEDETTEVLWGHDDDYCESICCCSGFSGTAPSGAVDVLVLRRDGRPAVGALVCVGGASARTDLHGHAHLLGVREGEHRVSLDEPGLVLTESKVSVRAGTRTRATLREAAGGTIALQVVDARGGGLPYATLSLPRGAQWVDLQDGVQRIDRFTDVEGRRILRHFPAGTWTVEAIYGARRAKAKLVVRSGMSTQATLTIR